MRGRSAIQAVTVALTLHLWTITSLRTAHSAEDFTGHVSFNIGSESGRVENISVTVGDGGTGPYKAILSGDSTLPTHTIYRPRDLTRFGPYNAGVEGSSPSLSTTTSFASYRCRFLECASVSVSR